MIEEQTYQQWEQRRIKNEEPVVTKLHEKWFRLVNNTIQSKVWKQPQIF